jgi:hypothetical protein
VTSSRGTVRVFALPGSYWQFLWNSRVFSSVISWIFSVALKLCPVHEYIGEIADFWTKHSLVVRIRLEGSPYGIVVYRVV